MLIFCCVAFNNLQNVKSCRRRKHLINQFFLRGTQYIFYGGRRSATCNYFEIFGLSFDRQTVHSFTSGNQIRPSNFLWHASDERSRSYLYYLPSLLETKVRSLIAPSLQTIDSPVNIFISMSLEGPERRRPNILLTGTPGTFFT